MTSYFAPYIGTYGGTEPLHTSGHSDQSKTVSMWDEASAECSSWPMEVIRNLVFTNAMVFNHVAVDGLGVCEQALSQYQKRRLSVRSRKVSKPRDLYLELSDRSEIWQALRQQCCRCACQISKRYDNLKYQSRGFETLRDLTKRRLFGYWDGALVVWVDVLMLSLRSLYSNSKQYSTDN